MKERNKQGNQNKRRFLPARAVRPTRWTYSLGTNGTLWLTIRSTVGISRPLKTRVWIRSTRQKNGGPTERRHQLQKEFELVAIWISPTKQFVVVVSSMNEFLPMACEIFCTSLIKSDNHDMYSWKQSLNYYVSFHLHLLHCHDKEIANEINTHLWHSVARAYSIGPVYLQVDVYYWYENEMFFFRIEDDLQKIAIEEKRFTFGYGLYLFNCVCDSSTEQKCLPLFG